MGQSTPYSRHFAGSDTDFVLGQADTDGLSVDVITTIQGFLRLEMEWDALYDECKSTATVFQTYHWARQCCERSGESVKLCILTGRNRGRLVAVAPLIIDRRFGLPAVRWIGGSLAIYGDVLALPSVDVGEWLTEAVADLSRRRIGSCLFLENVRADALIAPFLREGGLDIGRQVAPMLDMAEAGHFERWRDGLSKSTRRGRSRRLRNLEAKGAVSFTFERGGAQLRERVGQLFELKRAWAKSRTVLSRTIEDVNFESMVCGLVCGSAGIDSRVSTLFLDGKPIAIELGFVTGDRYLSYLGAYDPELHSFSPGSLQLERTLEACFQEGLKSFDLLPPNDAYKTEWTNLTVPVVSYALPITSLGVLQREFARIDLVGLAKAGIKHVPQPLKRALRSIAQHQPDGGGTAQRYLRRLTPRSPSEWSIIALAIAASAIMAAD